MKTIIKTLGFLLLLFIVASNYYPTDIGKPYRFENLDSSFQYTLHPSKGGSIEQMEGAFTKFQIEKGEETDKLYRTFPKEWRRFWMWRRYFFGELYEYPYKET